MKLDQKAKVFIATTLVSVSCAGFITTAAASAQTHEVKRPHRPATAQRAEREPEPPRRMERAPEPPAPEPRPPAGLTINIG